MSKFSVDPVPSEMLLILADRFQKLRKSKGFSQVELAERSGVSLGSLKRFERTGQISLISLLKLMHLLGNLQEVNLLFKSRPDQSELAKLFSK